MRLIFMGTPDFAVPTLAALCDAGHEIAAVYSRPPTQAGRGLAERPSPVHRVAVERGLRVCVPSSLRGADRQQEFAAFGADAAVVVAYGLILPKPVLDAPKYGAFNVHASLLPRWRGAAPIQRAIMAGDAKTGISIMRMSEGLDEGAVCLASEIPITPATTAGALHDLLAAEGARLMRVALEALEGGLPCKPQPSDGVVYAKKIDKGETHIDFGKSATEVRNHIHGLSPSPGAWFRLAQGGRSVRVKVLSCQTAAGSGPSGTALDERLTFACGSDCVRLLIVQREGGAPMEASAFLRGFPVPRGARAE